MSNRCCVRGYCCNCRPRRCCNCCCIDPMIFCLIRELTKRVNCNCCCCRVDRYARYQ